MNICSIYILHMNDVGSSKRWQGRFSEMDLDRWTPELKAELDYDPADQQYFDNGVFWIDYESVLRYFADIAIAWNPDFYPHQRVAHGSIAPNTKYAHHRPTVKLPPKKKKNNKDHNNNNEDDAMLVDEEKEVEVESDDVSNNTGNDKYRGARYVHIDVDPRSYATNPQYVLSVNASFESSVWLLLSPHYTSRKKYVCSIFSSYSSLLHLFFFLLQNMACTSSIIIYE